jgi:hypothetical protein
MKIEIGSRWMSHNWRECVVLGIAWEEPEFVGGVATGKTVTWWATTDGPMDSTRLHPIN